MSNVYPFGPTEIQQAVDSLTVLNSPDAVMDQIMIAGVPLIFVKRELFCGQNPNPDFDQEYSYETDIIEGVDKKVLENLSSVGIGAGVVFNENDFQVNRTHLYHKVAERIIAIHEFSPFLMSSFESLYRRNVCSSDLALYLGITFYGTPKPLKARLRVRLESSHGFGYNFNTYPYSYDNFFDTVMKDR